MEKLENETIAEIPWQTTITRFSAEPFIAEMASALRNPPPELLAALAEAVHRAHEDEARRAGKGE